MMNYSGQLESLIAPVTLLSFEKDYFEKKPLLVQRNDPDYFRDRLSIESINTYLECKDIRYPAIRLVRDGKELSQTSYLKSFPFSNQVFARVIDNDRLFNAFSNGATIVFQALHRSLPSLSLLCQQLEQYFKFPLQTNIYLTPAASQGFAAHFDNHDVFVLQTYGSKKWRIYDSPVFLPKEPFDKNKWVRTEPQIEVELQQGDVLYIPRGFVHEAATNEVTSMHITIGLLSYTWIDTFRLLLEKAKDLKSFRKTFNWSELSESELKKNLSELMGQLLEQTDADDIQREFNRRFVKKSLSSDKNRLLDVINQEKITTTTKFKVRKEINFILEKKSDALSLSFYDKKITFPLYVYNSLQSVLAKGTFRATDLEGDLDETGNLVLCRKLLKEGFLTMFDNG